MPITGRVETALPGCQPGVAGAGGPAGVFRDKGPAGVVVAPRASADPGVAGDPAGPGVSAPPSIVAAGPGLGPASPAHASAAVESSMQAAKPNRTMP